MSPSAAQRRVTRLESSLTPTQAVLHWLDEAHAFPSLDAYIRATLTAPFVPTPLDGVIQSVETGIRESMKGKPREAVENALTHAARQAVFRCLLALRLNEIASEEARLKGVIATCLFFWMRALASDELVQEATQKLTQRNGRETTWSRWREAVTGLLVNVYVEDEARLILEHDFLDGHPVLFDDVARDWTEAVEQAERLARIANLTDQLENDEPALSIAEVDLSPFRVRATPAAAKRAAYLADIARARTLDMSRQEERALQIMARHFGGQAADDPAT